MLRKLEPEDLISKKDAPRHCGQPLWNCGAGAWECLTCDVTVVIDPAVLHRLKGKDTEQYRR